MTYHAKFTIHQLPKITTNANSSWRMRYAEATKWKKLVHTALLINRAIPEKPLKRAELVLTRGSSIRPDHDNLVSSFKHIQDALVEARVIDDDSQKTIGAPTYPWEKAPPGKGFVTIEIRGIE